MVSVLRNAPHSFGAFKINARLVYLIASSVITQLRADTALRVRFCHLMGSALIQISVLQYLPTLLWTISAKFVRNRVLNALNWVNVYSVRLTHICSKVSVLTHAPSR
jgi:hypothetical protein